MLWLSLEQAVRSEPIWNLLKFISWPATCFHSIMNANNSFHWVWNRDRQSDHVHSVVTVEVPNYRGAPIWLKRMSHQLISDSRFQSSGTIFVSHIQIRPRWRCAWRTHRASGTRSRSTSSHVSTWHAQWTPTRPSRASASGPRAPSLSTRCVVLLAFGLLHRKNNSFPRDSEALWSCLSILRDLLPSQTNRREFQSTKSIFPRPVTLFQWTNHRTEISKVCLVLHIGLGYHFCFALCWRFWSIRKIEAHSLCLSLSHHTAIQSSQFCVAGRVLRDGDGIQDTDRKLHVSRAEPVTTVRTGSAGSQRLPETAAHRPVWVHTHCN